MKETARMTERDLMVHLTSPSQSLRYVDHGGRLESF